MAAVIGAMALPPRIRAVATPSSRRAAPRRRRAAPVRARPTLALALALALAVALAPRAADSFGFNSVLALIVGDVTTPFPGAPVTIVEVDFLSGALLDSFAVPNTTMPGNDNDNKFVGALVLCGDMSCVSYVGQSSTAAGIAAGDVVIHRHKNVDLTLALGDTNTTIPGAAWGGPGQIAKAACSMDGTGYWVVGQPSPVRYVPHGGTQNGVVVNAGFTTAGGNLNGCQLMAANASSGLTKAMYLEGSSQYYGYVFSASTPTQDWTASLTLPAQSEWKYINGNSYYGKQVISNRARTRFFLNEPYKCGYSICTGIWKCDGAAGVCGSPSGPDTYSFWSQDYLVTGGIALSPDDAKLFYTTAQQIWWVSALGASAGPPTAVGPALSTSQGQYRGISWAPITPTCGLGSPGTCCSPGMPGVYCAGGALPLLPCPPGSSSTGGGTACAFCAAGTYASKQASRLCSPCAAGVHCSGGAMFGTLPCGAGYYCAAAVAPVACSAGVFCPGGAVNNSVTCPAGYYCPGSGAAPAACSAGTFSAATGQNSSSTCSACQAGTFAAAGSAACTTWTQCNAGTYVSAQGTSASDRVCTPCTLGVGYSTSANAASCSSCTACAAGSAPATPCTTTSNSAGACSACPAGRYSITGTVACAVCPSSAAYGTTNTGAALCTCAAGNTWRTSSPTEGACAACSTSCAAGLFPSAACTITTDLVCAACPAGTYSVAPSSGPCTAWSSTCAAGSVRIAAGTATSDACEPCAANTFRNSTSTIVGDTCTTCSGADFVIGTLTGQTTCVCATGYTYAGSNSTCVTAQPCAAGTWSSTGFAAPFCEPWATCAAGTHISVPGSVIRNRECAPCVAGVGFSTTTNAAYCSLCSCAATCTATRNSIVACAATPTTPHGNRSTEMPPSSTSPSAATIVASAIGGAAGVIAVAALALGLQLRKRRSADKSAALAAERSAALGRLAIVSNPLRGAGEAAAWSAQRSASDGSGHAADHIAACVAERASARAAAHASFKAATAAAEKAAAASAAASAAAAAAGRALVRETDRW